MAAKKTYTDALRAHQKQEEYTGFRHEDPGSPGVESEDDPDLEPFTSHTVNPSTPATIQNPDARNPAPIKTTYRNGMRLVHRVPMMEETVESVPVSLFFSIN